MGPWPQDQLPALVRGLLAKGRETEWIEFKHNNADPATIGEYISALSNAAALDGEDAGFLVWGVEDGTNTLVGTTFDPTKVKGSGNEDLISWLSHLSTPRLDFRFSELELDGHRLVLLEIPAATTQPVCFRSEEYIRIGSHKQKLRGHPEKERALWQVLNRTSFEGGAAMQGLDTQGVLARIDYASLLDLLKLPHPQTPDLILEVLAAEGIVTRSVASTWSITNFGAILFAKDLNDFLGLSRKAVRVIEYHGPGRLLTKRERVFSKGYAVDFEDLIDFVMGLLPSNEVLEKAVRKTIPMLPDIAVREILANALIHQDFQITGTGPMIEVFDGRVEVTNSGAPLVETDRFLDKPPRSRNELLASMMRRIGYCEERGSGIDKVVASVEVFQLPAPLFEAPGDSTRVTLFGHKDLSDMGPADRTRAVYQHACLRLALREPMTNATLRERFGIKKGSAATASRLIKEAMDAGVIGLVEEGVGARRRNYVPFWAIPSANAGGA